MIRPGSGSVAESRTSGWNIRRVFGFVHLGFGRGHILFGNDIIDGL